LFLLGWSQIPDVQRVQLQFCPTDGRFEGMKIFCLQEYIPGIAILFHKHNRAYELSLSFITFE
jgi:hypothetical protein